MGDSPKFVTPSAAPLLLGPVTLHLPVFYPKNPLVWFSLVESQFVTRGVISPVAKFHHVVQALPMDVAESVADILASPTGENPYLTLKDAILSRNTASTQEKVRNVTQNMTLGSQKPSQLLRKMQQELASFSADETLVRELWIQKLPQSVAMVLAPVHSSSLSVVAEVADNAMAYYPQDHYPTPPPATFKPVDMAGAVPPTNVDQMAAILARLDRLELGSTPAPQGPRRSRSQSRGPRRRSPANETKRTLCWYHHKWGAKARNCVAPCQWVGSNLQGNALANE